MKIIEFLEQLAYQPRFHPAIDDLIQNQPASIKSAISSNDILSFRKQISDNEYLANEVLVVQF